MEEDIKYIVNRFDYRRINRINLSFTEWKLMFLTIHFPRQSFMIKDSLLLFCLFPTHSIFILDFHYMEFYWCSNLTFYMKQKVHMNSHPKALHSQWYTLKMYPLLEHIKVDIANNNKLSQHLFFFVPFSVNHLETIW